MTAGDATADQARAVGGEYVPAGYQPAFVRVSDLPAALAVEGRGAGYLPIVQFIKDWNRMPSCRDAMIADDPPAGTDAVTAAKIAAVVHALCADDGRPPPSWVLSAAAPSEVALVPSIDLASGFGRDVRAAAPAVCAYHRVYFSGELLDST